MVKNVAQLIDVITTATALPTCRQTGKYLATSKIASELRLCCWTAPKETWLSQLYVRYVKIVDTCFG